MKTRFAPDDPIPKARGPEAQHRRLARLAATLPQQQRLAEINSKYLPRVLAIVSGKENESLEREYLRQEFPFIHPDQCDPTKLMQRMLGAKGLDPELRILMLARMDSWRTQYARITSEMESLYHQFDEEFARSFTSGPEPTATIRKLRLDRWDCSKKAVDAIQAMLPGDIKATFGTQVDGYKSRLTGEPDRESNARRGNP